MSAFLTITDYQTRLSLRVIELLTENNNANLDAASNEATGLLLDRLLDKYAIDGELAKTGTDRNAVLFRWSWLALL